MAEINDDIKSVIDSNKAKAYEKKKQEWEKLENDKSDCLEAVEVLGGAVACGFLDDRHSLILQDWIKEYQTRADLIDNYLDGAKK